MNGGSGIITEAEIREFEQRRAWEDAQRAAQERADAARPARDPGTQSPKGPAESRESVDVNSLPNAEVYGGGTIGQPKPDKGLLEHANDLGYALPWSPDRVTNKQKDEIKPGSAGAEEGSSEREDSPDEPEPVGDDYTGKKKPAGGGSSAPGRSDDGGRGAPSYEGSGGSSYSRGSSGVLIPGGMQPNTEERDVKHGKVVAPGVREAVGEAGRLQMQGAEQARAANADMYAHDRDVALARMAAGQTAQAQQQRLQEERDAMVSARLAEIEQLNKKAQGSPEDLWSAPHVLGRLSGFIMLALGTALVAAGGKRAAAVGIPLAMGGKFVDGLINQDIASKLQERKEAKDASGRAVNLLHLHEEQMGNRAKAIDATKMAYYDNVLQQLDAYKAEHRGEINEGAYNDLRSQVLKSQADTFNRLGIQEQADVTDKLANKYAPARMLGGFAGGPTKDIPYQITLPDSGDPRKKTTYALPSEAIHKDVLKHVTYRQQIQDMDNEALQVRGRLSQLNPVSDREEFLHLKGTLERIGQDRLNAVSVAADQGVVNASDRRAEEAHGTAITSGYDYVQSAGHGVPGYSHLTDQERRAGDAILRDEVKRKQSEQRAILEGARARVITPGYNVDPNTGDKQPVAQYEGKDATPRSRLAPSGSESRDSRVKVPTLEDRPEGETTASARVLSQRPTNLPTPAGHHSKKKK